MVTTKFCPFKYSIKTDWNCEKEDCAWHDPAHKCCAILRIVTYEFNNDIKQELSERSWRAKLIFENLTEEQMEYLYKAEDALAKAGVIFDTGCNLHKDGRIDRVWELDWSLKGAKMTFEEPKDET